MPPSCDLIRFFRSIPLRETIMRVFLVYPGTGTCAGNLIPGDGRWYRFSRYHNGSKITLPAFRQLIKSKKMAGNYSSPIAFL
jgi:hypothetical protein